MTLEPSPRSDPPAGRAAQPLPWRGLALQVFVLIVLPLTALLLVITFGSLALHQQAMRDLVGERDILAVHTAAAAVTEQAQQRANLVRLLALQAEGQPAAALPAILTAAEFLQDDFDQGLAFYTPEGQLEAAAGNERLWNALAAQLPAYLPQTAARGPHPLYLSNEWQHPETGERLLLILALDAAQARLTAGAVTATALVEPVFLHVATEAHGTSFILVDAHQQAVFRAGQFFNEGPLEHHSGVAEALQGQTGTTYQRVGADEHVVAYGPVALLDWGLVSEEPWEMVDTPLLRLTQAAPLVLVPVLILALVALGFAIRQIVRPLQQLEAQAARLARGDFAAIEAPVGGIAEIHQLQTGLIDMAHQVQAAQRSLHTYIGAITTAQEEERRRLARELHDDTIQTLIALKQRVYLAEMKLKNSGEPPAIEEITQLTEQTIENLRRLTRALRPIYLEDLGLAAALEMLARETSQTAGLPVTYSRRGEERRLQPETELALYRMAQEALNNTVRHAQATQAGLSIDYVDDGVMLAVTDNGQGFTVPDNPTAFAPAGHYGLLGLHERAELIGARLAIQSAPGRGTAVRVSL